MKAISITYALTLLASNSAAFIPTTQIGQPSRINLHDRDDAEQDERKIPMLPAIGGSSFGDQSLNAPGLSSDKPSFVGEKFELQYTCKVCETRNTNRVSRIGTFCWIFSTFWLDTSTHSTDLITPLSHIQLTDPALLFAFARAAPVTIGSQIISAGPTI
jgi:hypothetical protein